MNKRIYNVFFHLHTVSGIVISVALYIIFFCGSFAFFKEDIEDWESNSSVQEQIHKEVDYDQALDFVKKNYYLQSRDIHFYSKITDRMYMYLYPTKDTLAPKDQRGGQYLNLHLKTQKPSTYEATYNMGEFLYRLHFFNQIPNYGIYIAGLVSLFFLFAVITGLVIHWDKIVQFFYFFKPNSSLKRVWTDAHTALGTVGLPFQIMYAITGAYFGLKILALLPANTLYNSDRQKMLNDLLPKATTFVWEGTSDKTPISINKIANHYTKDLDRHIKFISVKNFGGKNMKYLVSHEPTDKEYFLNPKISIINAYNGQVEKEIPQKEESGYITKLQHSVDRLHYGDYGGIAVKIVYFLMAMATCFVIITGVLIWLEARNRKNMTFAQRMFTADVGHIYIAICSSMLPVTALSFIIVKFLPVATIDKQTIIYIVFFSLWIVFSLYYRFKRDNYLTNKQTLLLGAVLGFCIPIINGIMTGNWFWKIYQYGQFPSAIVDILWILLSVIALFVYLKIKPSVKQNSAFTKLPIDFKNRVTILKEENKKHFSTEKETKNEISMRTKIALLWLFTGVGWLTHHIYGLFGVYYKESLLMEGADGSTPLIHHIFRILFEGIAFVLFLLTLEVKKRIFMMISLIWAIISGIYNLIHLVGSLIHDPSNFSELLMLILMLVASILLIINIQKWRKHG